MKTVLIFVSILLFLSCKQEKNYPEFIPEAKINPWEFINRISDTLEETEFSLFNDKESNRRIFKDSIGNVYWIRYRVGQNKYIPVMIANLNLDPGIVVCYSDDFFDVRFKENGDFMVLNTVGNNSNKEISTNFKKFLIKKYEFSSPRNRWPLFSIRLHYHKNQEVVTKLIEQIAEGYIEYMNELSIYKFGTEFINLDFEEQNLLMASLPLILDYDFHRLFPIPPVILKNYIDN